jgi:mRNA-degrading endonuclease RelE of RelBE toxin-antitoxin system
MIKVIFTPAFNQTLKKLRKRYPHILNDIEPLAIELESGQTPGDRIQGLPYKVYKVRIKNSDAKRGKSGDYRTIYYIETAVQITVITIYSKSDQSDIPTDVIRRLIEEYEEQEPPTNSWLS